MELNIKKTLLAGAMFCALNTSYIHAFELCGEKTLGRQGDVPINEIQCITDYGHYLYFTVPYENSNVTITTSGGDTPEPMGDYIVFDTNIPTNLPAPVLTSKSQYGAVISTILAAFWSDFEASQRRRRPSHGCYRCFALFSCSR